MMLLLVGGAIAVWLVGFGGLDQVKGMIGGLGGGGGGSSGGDAASGGGISVGLDSGVNVGGIHVGFDGIRVPGLVNIGGITGNVGSGLSGVGNNTKIQRNINTSGSPGVTQTSNINQSHSIVQQNGKTISESNLGRSLFESNLGRMSYN